jgi:hypothetical protein
MTSEMQDLLEKLKKGIDQRYALKDRNCITKDKIDNWIKIATELPTQQESDAIFNVIPAKRGNYLKIGEIPLENAIYDISYLDYRQLLWYSELQGNRFYAIDVNNPKNIMGSSYFNGSRPFIMDSYGKIFIVKGSNSASTELNVYEWEDNLYDRQYKTTIDYGMIPTIISIDADGETFVVTFKNNNKVMICDIDENYQVTVVKEYDLVEAEGCEISKDGTYVVVKGKDGSDDTLSKIYEAKKENGMWSDLTKIIDAPSSGSFGAKKFALTLDKKVLFIGDHTQSDAGNNVGRVYAYYKNGDGLWERAFDINPPTNDADQKFGFAVACNWDGSKVWISPEAGSFRGIYEYKVEV